MFEFVTTPHVVFGVGTVRQVGALAAPLGTRALVVTGRSTLRAEVVCRSLAAAGVATTNFAVEGEPSVGAAQAGAALARRCAADVVIGVGGGSALDAAKAIAALAANDGDLFDYLETIGRAQPLERPALPVIAVPTTAGTGSEATKNAVLSSPHHRVKVSVRHVSMLPRVALVDPELACGLPPGVTATTGLDALTQLVEPYVSHRHNPVTDLLALDGIRRVVRSLRRAVRDGSDVEARTDMAQAALWSGMALANAALGAVHGLAGPIGGMFEAPHGAVCAALLPHVMAINVAVALRDGEHATVARYDELARVLTGEPAATAVDGVRWVQTLVRDLDVPGLGAYGVTRQRAGELIEPARRASSMKGNPVTLGEGELFEVLDRSIGQ